MALLFPSVVIRLVSGLTVRLSVARPYRLRSRWSNLPALDVVVAVECIFATGQTICFKRFIYPQSGSMCCARAVRRGRHRTVLATESKHLRLKMKTGNYSPA
jgi:hypothetical protein